MNNQTSTNCIFAISEFDKVKEKVLNWTKRFNTFCLLDNHQYQVLPHSVECLVAAGVRRDIRGSTGSALPVLQSFIDEKKSWLFGHLGYDLKNEIEKLSSAHPAALFFPDLYFFEPEFLIQLKHGEITIEAENPGAVFEEINSINAPVSSKSQQATKILHRISREEYLSIIKNLQHHIRRGDCYEINFCQEFFAEGTRIDPLLVYKNLSSVSPNPFSALYKMNDQWLICASPERFLKKTGSKIISQPIKGTLKRTGNDRNNRLALYNSKKDRSENVMVVDLVRNDLSRVCEKGSVTVDELYGIYSFPQVHQMISTVSGIVPAHTTFTEIIRACFPMGSMTGAPKKKVMELIEQYEKSRRGIFSGALGYISPTGDFDFNVVIRSIMYNAATNYVSYQAGSAITFYSDAEKEWEECLLKGEAIKGVLSNL